VASSDREEIDKLLAPLVEGGFTQKSTEEAPDGGCQGLLSVFKERVGDGQGNHHQLKLTTLRGTLQPNKSNQRKHLGSIKQKAKEKAPDAYTNRG